MRRACRGEGVDRPPVWLMRQAGRYLPEYRAIRTRASFLEMCRDSELAAEISLQPFRRFGMDGVVVFSDILIPLTALGLDVDFNPGPRVGNPITGEADLRRLEGDVGKALAPTCSAIRKLRGELGERAAVIGFAGAPWTLLAYALETQLSRDVVALGALSYRDPALLDRLLDRMAEICAETLRHQLEAGADVVQIFDTWAGVLSIPRFERFAGRALRAVIERLPRNGSPVIVFARGASHLESALAKLGAEVVSLDWRSDLGEAARRIGGRVSLQGNLDPAALMAAPEEIRRRVAELIQKGRAARGHVLNLGHGVQQGTPVEGVQAFVEAAQSAGA
jgi:uroporphyrinogen decarboxylase